MSAVRKPSDADLLALVLAGQSEILAEVRALRAELAVRGARPAPESVAELVRCLSQLPAGTAFSVAELLEHAQVVPATRAAIIAAVGAPNGRKLGKLLRRIEGLDFDGACIVRSGSTREGVSWRLEGLRV
jgi:hypothetical protein